jgi:hypothetical protein
MTVDHWHPGGRQLKSCGCLVSKLKAARDRKRRETGRKVEGRKSYAEISSDLVRLAYA